jgi:hypothetical protein
VLRVAITDLKPGMKLGKPIQNDSGMVLLPEGTELTLSIIDRIDAMGISSVLIQGKKVPLKPKEELLEEVNERFKKTENERHMDLIKRLTIEHINKLYE